MSTRLKSVIAFIVLILLIALVFHPSRTGEVVVTQEGHTHFSISNVSALHSNERFSSTTVLNGGSGRVILQLKILGLGESTCKNESAMTMLMEITASGYIPNDLVPKDAVLTVQGLNGTMLYSFIMNNNSGINATPWPAEGSMGAPQAWSPKSIYDGFKPNSSNFTVSTNLLWTFVPLNGGTLKISARLYGFKNMIESTVEFDY